MTRNSLLLSVAIAALSIAACEPDRTVGPAHLAASRLAAVAATGPGAVYAETNAAAGNGIATFRRAPDGSITVGTTVSTGGAGAGTNLGSQGAVALSDNGHWLFAVNAGSNDVSVFAVDHDLTLVTRFASGGVMPISLTLHGHLVYVLNAGGRGSITGFRLGEDGRATPIPGSTRALSDSNVGPAEVAFANDGRSLVVTEKNTNLIDVYAVDPNGVASGPTTHASAGVTPFGFSFGSSDELLVSEAAGSVSSYDLDRDGTLTTVSAAVATHHAAPCWIVVTQDGRFAYAANAHDGSISGFSVTDHGSLALLSPNGTTATPGPGNLDLAFSADGYLYQLRSGGPVTAYRVAPDGQLTLVNVAGSMSAGVTGLAAR